MRHKVSAGKTAATNGCHIFSRVIGKRVSNLNCCIQLHYYVVICDNSDFQFNLSYFQVDGDDRTVFHYIDTAGFLVLGVDRSDNLEVRFIYNRPSFLSEISDSANT